MGDADSEVWFASSCVAGASEGGAVVVLVVVSGVSGMRLSVGA